MFLATGRSLGVACTLAPAAVAPATSPAPPLMLGLARVGSACARHGSAASLGLSRFALLGTLHRRPLLSAGSLAALRPWFALYPFGTLLAVGAILARTVAATFVPLVAAPVTAETLVLAILAATAEAIAVAAVATSGTLRGLSARPGCRHRLRPRRGCRVPLEPAEDPADDSRPRRGGRPLGRARGFPSRGLRRYRRGPLRRDTVHCSLLALRLCFLCRLRLRLFFGRRGGEVVARGQRFGLVEVVVPQALHLVIRRFQVDVRNQHDVDLEPRLDGMNVGAFLVQQERSDIHRHLGVHRRAVLLHRLFLDDAQDMERRGLRTADMAGAVAARAGDVAAFPERGTQPLARKLHQAEARDLAHLHPRPVEAQRFAQAVLHLALVALVLHVDEIDDDEPAQVAKPEVARDELTSMETSASVWSITTAPPEGSDTWRE